MSNCTALTSLNLMDSQITDLAPLLTNAAARGLGPGDQVWLGGNPLSKFAQTNQIPILRNTYGVSVYWP